MRDKRVYKLKKPRLEFFCPLCGAERGFIYSSHFSKKNYVQLIISSLLVILVFYPLIGAKSFVSFFLIWGGMEFIKRVLFKNEIPCPYCGFDATWYKKDVKVARQKVEEFWKEKMSDTEKNDALAS